MSRRGFVRALGALAATPLLSRCNAFELGSPFAGGAGRFTARLRPPSHTAPVGTSELSLPRQRPTLLYVPQSYSAERVSPLVVCLHGAGGSGQSLLDRYKPYADIAGAIILAPSSTDYTWDAIGRSLLADFPHIDAALQDTFDRCAIDPTRVAIAGFSDGATYALSLGVVNGDLATHVVGMSPGYVLAGDRHGMPRVFISHGAQDQVLPIDECGRAIANALRGDGYAVQFSVFEGGHEIPEAIMSEATAAIGWSPLRS